MIQERDTRAMSGWGMLAGLLALAGLTVYLLVLGAETENPVVIILALVVVAVAWRLLLGLVGGEQTPVADGAHFHRIACSLVRGDGFGTCSFKYAVTSCPCDLEIVDYGDAHARYPVVLHALGYGADLSRQDLTLFAHQDQSVLDASNARFESRRILADRNGVLRSRRPA